jgi:hypothetical protein
VIALDSKLQLACECGHVGLELAGRHIVSTECCCESCRTAGRVLETLPSAPGLLEENGTTRFVLWRKDRVECVSGAEVLREFRLQSDSSSRRVVAVCCNTAMFLEFTKGHWLSLYGRRFPTDRLPPLDLRTMTTDLPVGVRLSDDVPNSRTQSFTFFRKLFAAWAAMGFRTPRIAFVNGGLDID